mmetsp:Transcript_1003/g.1612  ORF Transcript_1003/g.1612 Transcript_1003/m.1612 type:complete len:211 (+) Transcript_1003:1914-2546(+)
MNHGERPIISRLSRRLYVTDWASRKCRLFSWRVKLEGAKMRLWLSRGEESCSRIWPFFFLPVAGSGAGRFAADSCAACGNNASSIFSLVPPAKTSDLAAESLNCLINSPRIISSGACWSPSPFTSGPEVVALQTSVKVTIPPMKKVTKLPTRLSTPALFRIMNANVRPTAPRNPPHQQTVASRTENPYPVCLISGYNIRIVMQRTTMINI